MSEQETFVKKIYLSLQRIYGQTVCLALDWVRSGPALFFTFIYPVIMILLFGYIFGAVDDNLYTLNYLNEDVYQVGENTYAYNPANQILENLGLNNDTLAESLNLKLVEASIESSSITYNDWMKNNDIPYLLVIPSGWSAAANESKINATAPQALIEYYYDPSYTTSSIVQSIIDNVLQEMNLAEFSIPTMMGVVVSTTPSREGLNYIHFIIPGVIMVTISTSGMIGLVATVTETKQSGILYKLSASPLKKWEWALSQELWQAFVSIVVSILSVFTGWLVFGFKVSTIHPLMVVVLIFGSMTFAGLALIIARFVKKTEAAMAATMSFVFPQMFLSGAILPAEILPDFMQTIAKFFPLYYIGEAMRNMMLESTFHLVWAPLGITIGMGVVFFIVGTIITVWRKE